MKEQIRITPQEDGIFRDEEGNQINEHVRVFYYEGGDLQDDEGNEYYIDEEDPRLVKRMGE